MQGRYQTADQALVREMNLSIILRYLHAGGPMSRASLASLAGLNKTTVSSLVHIYSIGYMHEDDSRPRFFAYLSLFTFAMLMLVTSDNLVQMFFGWEGVGLCSYLLIGYYIKKDEARKAAKKAFVMNRIGDVGVVLGLAVLGGLAMALGVAVRLAAPVAFVAVTSLMASAPLMLNGGDDVLRLLLLFIALYAVIAPADGLNTAVGRLGLSEPPTGPPWGLVVIRIQIIAMYIVTVLDKMEGSTWLGGTATIRALNLQSMRRFWVPEFMLTSSAAHNLMTWGTLATEVAIPILLINRRTRRWGIVLGVGFHAALGYVLRLGLFPATVTIAYLAFLTPAEASAIVGWVRRGADRIVGLRAKVPSPGTDQADDP